MENGGKMDYIERNRKRVNLILENYFKCCEVGNSLDIVKLANFLGFDVIEQEDFGKKRINAVGLRTYDNKIIYVNKSLTEGIKRYYIAYEIAYYFVYLGEETYFEHVNYNSIKEVDKEVEDFALSLLRGYDDFIKMYPSLSRKFTKNEIMGIMKNRFYSEETKFVHKVKTKEKKKDNDVKYIFDNLRK